jgi:hypothetical protein
MSPIKATIDFTALLDVVIASVVAGAVIVSSHSLCLYGLTEFLDRRHAREGTRALPFAILGALGGAAFAAAVVYGFIIMTTK